MLVITGTIGVFLFVRGAKAIRVGGAGFLTTQQWFPDTHKFGIATLLTGSVLIAVVGVAVAFPLSLAMSLFVSEIAPIRVKRFLVLLLDLMAAIPSVVFGLWGLGYFQAHVIGVARWLATWMSWFPPFKVPGYDRNNPLSSPTIFTASTFVAGIVVGLLILPIMTSIMRESFSQAPPGEREGAYALGSTRWGMIRTVVLPFGRGGIIGGAMLGLGRLLGETVVVVLIISPSVFIQWHVLRKGANSVSANIALKFGESSQFGLSALLASGAALFVVALLVNFGASLIVARSRSGALSEV